MASFDIDDLQVLPAPMGAEAALPSEYPVHCSDVRNPWTGACEG